MSKKVISAEEMPEGDGARVKRLFPNSDHDIHHDPFVLMDEFFVEPPNEFSSHEHRGFEAITYMLEGHFIHEDNQGNNAKVGPGGVQAFNAGKSIIHSEKPGSEGLSHGIQLWINLPQNKKQSEPEYQDIKASQIPKIENEKFIINKVAGTESPLKMNTEIKYFDIIVKENTVFSRKLPENQAGIIYLIKGEIKGKNKKESEDNILLDNGDGILIDRGEDINIDVSKNTRFLLLSGVPHNNDIKINGTFVE